MSWARRIDLQSSACRAVIASGLGLLLACKQASDAAPAASRSDGARSAADTGAAPQADVRPKSSAGAADPALPGAGMRFAGRGPEQDFVLEQLARAKPLSFKPVASGSTVMRVRLAAAFDAAFKPAIPSRPLGPIAEVSAYRLARCLALDNVPPAISRAFSAAELRAGLDPSSSQSWPKLREELAIADDDTVHGAMILWVTELEPIGLDRRSGLHRAGEWLRVGGELPARWRSLAASVSSMLAFDYVIGNFDRWSGGNVRGDAAGTRVYARDHDLAFPVRMTEKLHRRLWHDVQHAERFSRRFYRLLEQLTRECFERELARDPAGARGQLLSERQLQGVFDRREALISHIQSLIAVHGEHDVLVFP